jgi:hypothetical protein
MHTVSVALALGRIQPAVSDGAGARVCLFGAQWAGLALAGNAAKDMAVSVRSPKTKFEAQSACKLAGWSWLAGSAFRRVRCAALLRASRFHSRTTRGLCSQPARASNLSRHAHARSLGTTLQNKQKDDVGFASAAVMGVLVRACSAYAPPQCMDMMRAAPFLLTRTTHARRRPRCWRRVTDSMRRI